MASVRRKVKIPEEVPEEVPEETPKETPKEAVVVICKGDRTVERTRIKMNAMAILIGFVRKVTGCEVLDDANTTVVILPDEEGDPKWLEENVIRYVSIVSSLMSSADITHRTEELYKRFTAAGGTPDKVGVGILREYLNKYYLIQKYASVFVRGV